MNFEGSLSAKYFALLSSESHFQVKPTHTMLCFAFIAFPSETHWHGLHNLQQHTSYHLVLAALVQSFNFKLHRHCNH
jgi:hypothetical protein